MKGWTPPVTLVFICQFILSNKLTYSRVMGYFPLNFWGGKKRAKTSEISADLKIQNDRKRGSKNIRGHFLVGLLLLRWFSSKNSNHIFIKSLFVRAVQIVFFLCLEFFPISNKPWRSILGVGGRWVILFHIPHRIVTFFLSPPFQDVCGIIRHYF